MVVVVVVVVLLWWRNASACACSCAWLECIVQHTKANTWTNNCHNISSNNLRLVWALGWAFFFPLLCQPLFAKWKALFCFPLIFTISQPGDFLASLTGQAAHFVWLGSAQFKSFDVFPLNANVKLHLAVNNKNNNTTAVNNKIHKCLKTPFTFSKSWNQSVVAAVVGVAVLLSCNEALPAAATSQNVCHIATDTRGKVAFQSSTDTETN